MQFHIGHRIRHPFFPKLKLTPAREAKSLNPALYGGFQELVSAGGAGARVRRAVFVTCLENVPLPSDSERDVLWEIFQVPAFAIVLDARGRVLAYECEAQGGLHVNDQCSAATARMEVCECGRPGRKVQATASVATLRSLAG